MLLMSQGRQQKADLAFHFVRSAYDELNFLPYQLGMAPAQSMHRRPDRAVAKVQAPGHLVVRAGFPVARQEPLQQVELRRLALAVMFLAQARQHEVRSEARR